MLVYKNYCNVKKSIILQTALLLLDPSNTFTVGSVDNMNGGEKRQSSTQAIEKEVLRVRVTVLFCKSDIVFVTSILYNI